MIIFASDNGHFDGSHGLNGKWLMHEESIHVPPIVRDPRLPATTRGRRPQMAFNIDAAPTILSMAFHHQSADHLRRRRIPARPAPRLRPGPQRPLPNLFVSLLQRHGIPTDKFATATGTMRGIEIT